MTDLYQGVHLIRVGLDLRAGLDQCVAEMNAIGSTQNYLYHAVQRLRGALDSCDALDEMNAIGSVKTTVCTIRSL